MTVLQGNSPIAQKSGEIWTGQADLQPIYFKSDRLLWRATFVRAHGYGPSGALLVVILTVLLIMGLI